MTRLNPLLLLLPLLALAGTSLPPKKGLQGNPVGYAAPESKKALDELKISMQNKLKFNSKELVHQRLRQASIGPEDTLFSLRDEALCSACEAVVASLKTEVALGVSYDTLLQEAIVGCSLGYSSLEYCQGWVPLVGPAMYHMLQNDDVSRVTTSWC